MDVPFESFALLIHRLGHPPKVSSRPTGEKITLTPSKIFASWLAHLPRPFPPYTGKHLFRLLFPHEGSRRRYGNREHILAKDLEKILGVSGLTRWDSVQWGEHGGSGCLGKEVEFACKDRSSSSEGRSQISIREVDQLLDQLAATSSFSQLSQQPLPSSRTEVLTRLFRYSGLSPYAMAVLTQVILRDLRPLLNPLPKMSVRNPTAMLRIKTTAAPAQLELFDAMRQWDPRMLELYRSGIGSLDRCADLAEKSRNASAGDIGTPVGPMVGINVQIPKCRKGRSIDDALNVFFDERRGVERPGAVWAETKYDGYRMQIHVELNLNGEPCITIFSKSKRDSTHDRINTHSILCATLGLHTPDHLPVHPTLAERMEGLPLVKPSVRKSVILEAEVLPYNEGQREGGRGPGLEEFWWLGAAGVTATDKIQGRDWRDRRRHLCLAFFDVLSIDGESLLRESYDVRRKTLERIVRPIPGFAFVAERTLISMTFGRRMASAALEVAFRKCCDDHQEGLILKAAGSTYIGMRWPWVKLKKDYIPDLGDCIDLVVLGAGWDLDRARELRVDTSVFTTFYIGTLTDSDKVKRREEIPHFEILFRASYGPNRDTLEIYNEAIRHGRWKTKSYDKDDRLKRASRISYIIRLLGLSWSYTLPNGIPPPSVLFEQPLCAEVMGAGFQKLPGGLYELRFPRLQKIYDSRDRPWIDALDSKQLIRTAHDALGYATTVVSQEDSLDRAWRSSSQYVIDIPDFPTPSPRKLPFSPTRAYSVPSIYKTSPPTPIRSTPVPSRSSPLKRPSEAAARLQDILRTPEKRKETWEPLSSHGKRLRLLSPPALTRKKRVKSPDEEIESWESFPNRDKRARPLIRDFPLPDPPRAEDSVSEFPTGLSQLLPSESGLGLRMTTLQPESLRNERVRSGKEKEKMGRTLAHLALRPLSIRSRLRMAMTVTTKG
ncbi:hypothetical protein TREMEDRAFT_73368 [Tremella mesenterica DSM 1558]|uniref:uncharacterized protein n=1 Tax=Tremella mesenterica (strain ATCC 24925 / CBS 8224 / DSM 1558 / NBRC 9311 / NRRL Y-6157 / RJB 2259-6 / UBC 559-6) TaxID=578456 RepID=UPI0003F49E2A|nr:uncharacterized protein TREMEDRAFT_73368 [Tremella mesenterica DSM 1558]EIW71652.1 hypothetical protein TREMEDRAFT_73368 [Tremella mesenterica DSM 1558]